MIKYTRKCLWHKKLIRRIFYEKNLFIACAFARFRYAFCCLRRRRYNNHKLHNGKLHNGSKHYRHKCFNRYNRFNGHDRHNRHDCYYRHNRYYGYNRYNGYYRYNCNRYTHKPR